MNLLKPALILFATLCAGLAQASPVLASYSGSLTTTPTGHASTGLSNGAGGVVSHMVAGEFIDTFSFAYSGKAWLDALLETQFSKPTQQITFLDIKVNGHDFLLDEEQWGRTTFGNASLQPILIDGDFVLTVHGWAGAIDASPNLAATASYSGILNITPLANEVPEPSGLALAGLGLVGALRISRRRKPT